jgi:hypothetical protein
MRYHLRTLLARLAAGPPIIETIAEYYGACAVSQQGTRRTALRFSIRDLLWLMLVVALSAGWWAEHRRADRALKHDRAMYSENARLRKQVAKLSTPTDAAETKP